MLQFSDVQCVAIADVQANRRDAGKALVDRHYQNKDCESFRDFRELLARNDIDAVLIATGDRWHAEASILAAKAGKDVYSEKPSGITIADCQRLAETMHQKNRIFQAGTQRRSVPNFQMAVEMAHSGVLGKLKTLHASVYRPLAKLLRLCSVQNRACCEPGCHATFAHRLPRGCNLLDPWTNIEVRPCHRRIYRRRGCQSTPLKSSPRLDITPMRERRNADA